MDLKNCKPGTVCIQGGWEPKKGEARVLPIYQSTTFAYETSEQMGRLFDLEDNGFFYTRLQNPTTDAVAAKIAALEGGVAAMLTSSGQAANFFAVLNICEAGDHLICSSAVYGGTFNLFGVTMEKMGIACTFVDPDDTEENLAKALEQENILAKAQTYAFTVLGMSQLFHAIGMRDMHKSFFRMHPLENKLMIGACMIGIRRHDI
ncbi:MAG: PLP-dependent transferase, partial [Peptococcaceae bacterium]|nr:PLP-dependent transferase [Peptococcaceae bacterium]